jgi:hypothetical protein
MAVITASFPEKITGKRGTILWEAMDGGDTGAPFELLDFNDNTVTVTGTFDSNTLTMQGSNDGTNWFTLTDNLGLAVTFTAAGGRYIAEAPRYIRPSLGSGASSDIDVTVQLRKA